ncbi:MAG: hypothetical protein IIA33_04290 [Planctomycetes bacterium]|nr:hypothetical protein [Planctomycetota bacterium]
MTGPDDNAPPPQVLPDTDLTICLHCGYNLRGLPAGHNCPECGHPSDRESARQEVLDVINQPMLKLGWRMLQFWKPLPPGWWWTLDRPEDRREARRRSWKWILSSWILLLVLSFPIVMVNRIVTITKYEHPPGDPEKKQVRARASGSGVMSSVSVTVTPSRPGWVVLTERTEEVVLDFQFNRMLRMAIFVVGIVLLTWLMMRWVWLPICLATGPRKKSAPELKAIKTIALYQYAPMLTLLLAVTFLSWINWALYTLGWINESRLIVVVAAPLLHVGLIGTTWASAIRSDRTGQIFRHKLLPILGIILAAGPGGMSATFLIGRLMTSLFP